MPTDLGSNIFRAGATFHELKSPSPGQAPAWRVRFGQLDVYPSGVANNARGANYSELIRLGGEWATVSIGPNSSISEVFVKPANGHPMRCAVGAPLPVGPWQGPFNVRINSPALGDVALDDDLPVNAYDYGSAATDQPICFVPCALELDFWPQVSQAMPDRRHVQRNSHVKLTGLDGLATLRLVGAMPFYGRRFGAITVACNAAGPLTFAVWGVHNHIAGVATNPPWVGGTGPGALWAKSLGTFSVVAGTSEKFIVDREHHGDWDRILLVTNGAQPAGPNQGQILYTAWDERD